jgi:hypothetical protein
MPDFGKGYQLLKLIQSCDAEEASDWAATAGVKERICIVDVKDRWKAPTSGGWSDVLLTFYFTDDANRHICEVQLVHADLMRVRTEWGAHSAYTSFRCALELLEATGHADMVEDMEAADRNAASGVDDEAFGSPLRVSTTGRGESVRRANSANRYSSSSTISDAAIGNELMVGRLETDLETLRATILAQSDRIASQAEQIEQLQEKHLQQISLIEAAETRADDKLVKMQKQIDTLLGSTGGGPVQPDLC